jgi:hypothetical protein
VAALATLFVLGLAQSLAHVWETVHRSTLGSAFDLERNNGVPDALSTIVLAAACAGAVVLALSTQTRRERRTAWALAGALAVLTLDDLAQESAGLSSTKGVVVLAIAGAAAGLALLVAAAGGRVRWTLLLGLGALASSVAVGEAPEVINWLERARGERLAELQIAVKQGLELAGWWLIALGLWDRAAGLRPGRGAPR